MKKLFLLTICALLFINNACKSQDKKLQSKDLPVAIQQFIKKYYPVSTIVVVTQEKDDKDYNVTLSGKTKLEFGKDYQWTEIYNKYGSIPQSLIPQEIISYVTSKYPRALIKRIERCEQGYDIDLNNRKHFQLNKNFQRTKFKESD